MGGDGRVVPRVVGVRSGHTPRNDPHATPSPSVPDLIGVSGRDVSIVFPFPYTTGRVEPSAFCEPVNLWT